MNKLGVKIQLIQTFVKVNLSHLPAAQCSQKKRKCRLSSKALQINFISLLLLSVMMMPGTGAEAQNTYKLRDALQQAKRNNPLLKTEQFNISIAEAEIIDAKLRPNLNLSAEALQLVRPSEFAPSTPWYNGQNREVLWQVSKPFQVAGQRKYKIDVARKNAALASRDYTEMERNLFLEVALKWLNIWTQQKQLEVLNQAKSNVDSLLRINTLRFENHVITQTDLYRTELLKRQFLIQLNIAQQEIANNRKELQFLMGVVENVQVDMAEQPFSITTTLDSLLLQSMEYRSDIVSTKMLIKASESNIKLQESLAYPPPELGLIWKPQNTVPYFGIYAAVDLPFFNRNQGEIKKSHYIKAQAEQQLQAVKSQARTEIETAFASYQVQRNNIGQIEEILNQSETILNNVQYAYLRGGTTIIDFLEAQRSWLETQQQYYEALNDYRESYIQLLYATGTINQLAE